MESIPPPAGRSPRETAVGAPHQAAAPPQQPGDRSVVPVDEWGAADRLLVHARPRGASVAGPEDAGLRPLVGPEQVRLGVDDVGRGGEPDPVGQARRHVHPRAATVGGPHDDRLLVDAGEERAPIRVGEVDAHQIAVGDVTELVEGRSGVIAAVHAPAPVGPALPPSVGLGRVEHHARRPVDDRVRTRSLPERGPGRRTRPRWPTGLAGRSPR